jgi:hypothetical protein
MGSTDNSKAQVQRLDAEPANGKMQRLQITSNWAQAAFVNPLP